MGKLSTDVCPFCRESHSLSVWASPLFPFPQHPLMAPAVGHSRTLQFLFSINRRGHFLVHHGICYLFRILQGPRLPLFFAPIDFCPTYCSDVYFFLPIPHILVSTYLRVLNSLSPKLNLSRYQMSHTGESDTHNCSFLHAFVSLYFHNFTICILKHP